MTLETLELITTDGTAARTLAGIGTFVFTCVAAYFLYFFAKWYNAFFESGIETIKAKEAYKKMVYAFKSGLIKQVSDAEEVELIYPEKEEFDLVKQIKEDVANDIKKI